MSELRYTEGGAVRRLGGYLRSDVRADAVAGLTVAVMGVPQAMAYALVAGLPPVYGLYTAIVTCLVAAGLGSSSHLVTGPTNASCMVILSLTAHLPQKYDIGVMEAVLLLTFLTGAVQFGFGLMRLGGVVRFVSSSVVIGFTAGAGILIAINQLQNILGVDLSGAGTHSYQVLAETLRRLPETNPYALGIGVATALILIVGPKVHRRVPAALVAVVVTGLACHLLGWSSFDMGASRLQIVQDIEPISGVLPSLQVPRLVMRPDLGLVRELGTGALALAILGLVEATSIARAVAASSGQRVDFSREFVSQGTAKMVGSFFQCFAGSGSFTRTAVCFSSGGRTRMAAIFSAGWTALALVSLGPLANRIPKAALAGILIVVAYSMIEKHRLKLCWSTGHKTRVVLVGTLVATLILPLEFAIFAGVLLSVLFLLRTIGTPDLTQLVSRYDSGFDEVPFNRAPPSPVVVVNMEGDLYFAAAEDHQHELLKAVTPRTRVVILRMKRLRAVGSTAMAMLEQFWKILGERGIHLVVCGIEDELRDLMTTSGLRLQIGEQNIFYADNKLLQSTELALARAWSIVELLRREQGKDEGREAVAPNDDLTAGDIMSRRCIRFGNQHQLREAVWLMSELQKQARSLYPEPLFLQNREAKLGGELSPWRILKALSNGTNGDHKDELDDRELGEYFRRGFTRSIESIARSDLPKLGEDASLARMLETLVERNLQVLPITDDAGRIQGLVSADNLLKALVEVMAGANPERTDD